MSYNRYADNRLHAPPSHEPAFHHELFLVTEQDVIGDEYVCRCWACGKELGRAWRHHYSENVAEIRTALAAHAKESRKCTRAAGSSTRPAGMVTLCRDPKTGRVEIWEGVKKDGVTLDRGLLRNDLEGLYWEIIKQHKLRLCQSGS